MLGGGVLRILWRNCVFAVVGVSIFSACSAPDLLLQGARPFANGPIAGDTSERRWRPSSSPEWESGPIALGADTERTKPEFVSRGTGQFVGKGGDPIITGKTVRGGDGVTINLLNAPIAQAAKSILGDILKANYVVSDKVTGTVTVQTSSPIEPAGLVDIFEAVLKANGVALLRGEGHYRLVPLATAGIAPVSLDGHPQGPGISTRIVSLKHVAAAEMRRVIEPMVGQGAILRVDDQRNLLVVNGTGRELANLDKLVVMFDVDWMRGMSFALFPVKTAEPEVVAKELETVFGLDKEGPLKGVVRILPNARLNSVLVMSSRPAHLDTARTWIERFEKLAEKKEEQVYTYKAQNRPAAELANLLQKILSTDEQPPAAAPTAGTAPRFEPATAVSSAPSGRDPRASVIPTSVGGRPSGSATGGSASRMFGSQQARGPAESGQTGGAFRAGGSKVVVDEQKHALVIQTVPPEYDRILRILRRLDVVATQVMLEAAIAEVTLTDELKFGLKWFFEKRHNNFTFTDAASGLVSSTFPGFSYFLSMNNMHVVLDAVASLTKVNVVSAPTLTVMDGRTAILQVGDQVPIITQTAQSVTNPDAPVVNTVQMRDTGVILSVTPSVSDTGRVLLDIEQEVSNVARTTSSGIDSPTIQQRRVKTTVTVMDGEAVALGGLIQERDSVNKTQVPFLGDLPLLGSAFRTKTDGIDRTELLIIIRPRALRDTEEAARATEEYRSRLNLEAPRSQTGRSKLERDIDRAVR
jgi:general secretion pathway protein D